MTGLVSGLSGVGLGLAEDAKEGGNAIVSSYFDIDGFQIFRATDAKIDENQQLVNDTSGLCLQLCRASVFL